MSRARLAGGAALVVAGLACAPADPGRTRPEGVRTTPYAQRDLRLDDARVGRLRLRYIDVGPREARASDGGVATLVLIPGHTSRIEEYDGLVPRLSRRFRVLVLDFPGSGYSDKPERDYDLALYEDTLVAFLDALGLERTHLAGGSLGGNLTLRLAHRFPGRFERLVPWAPGSAWEAHPGWARAMRAVAGYPLFWPVVEIQSRYWYSEDWPGREAALEDTFAYYREVLGPGFVRMYFGMAADQVARSLFELAPAIRHPVLLGWGDRDDGANMGEGVARLHELLPCSELRVFPDARHSLAAEIPGPLAEAIEEFLLRPAEALP